MAETLPQHDSNGVPPVHGLTAPEMVGQIRGQQVFEGLLARMDTSQEEPKPWRPKQYANSPANGEPVPHIVIPAVQTNGVLIDVLDGPNPRQAMAEMFGGLERITLERRETPVTDDIQPNGEIWE